MTIQQEVQRAVDYLAAVKARPVSEVSAERALEKKLRDVLDDVARATIDALDRSGRVPSDATTRKTIMQEFEKAIPGLAERTADDAVAAAQRGRNKVIDTMRKQGASGLAFDEVPKTVIDRIRTASFEASARTMARLAGDVQATLEVAFEEGLGVRGAADLLDSQFNNMKGFEVARIARTEMQSFQNVGAQQTMQDLGVQYQMWVTAGDSRVRDSHVDVEGEITALDQTHTNGLRFPLDDIGPLEEWVNCRCRAVPFIIPPGKAAPGPGPFYEDDLIDVKK